MNPLPPHTKLCSFFSNHFSLLRWVYDMKFFYLVYTDLLYFSIYFWSNTMDKPFCIPLISWNPWLMSLEITMNNAISLFYALKISSNIVWMQGYRMVIQVMWPCCCISYVNLFTRICTQFPTASFHQGV